MMKTHKLKTEIWLPQKRTTVFSFFTDPRNLEDLTPGWLHFEILTPLPLQMKSGVLIDYRLRLYGIPCIGKAKSVSGSRLIVLLTGKFGDLIELGYTNTPSLNLMAEPWWRTQSNMPRLAESSSKNYFSLVISAEFSPIDTSAFAKGSERQIRRTRRRSSNHTRFRKAKKLLLENCSDPIHTIHL